MPLRECMYSCAYPDNDPCVCALHQEVDELRREIDVGVRRARALVWFVAGFGLMVGAVAEWAVK